MALALEHEIDEHIAKIILSREDLKEILRVPSVTRLATLLIEIGVSDVQIRMALTTIVRFSHEVANDDLSSLLKRGEKDSAVAEDSILTISKNHPSVTQSQLASLAFGPKLWWRSAGVDIAWKERVDHIAGCQPLPQLNTDQDARLLLLAIIGSGATLTELASVARQHAGSLTSDGRIISDLTAEPLAISYLPTNSEKRRITFLSFDARLALLGQYSIHGFPTSEDPLLLPIDRFAIAESLVLKTSNSLIKAGNDVNVSLCRATGDFFRSWGMPGARFEEHAFPSTE